MIPKVPPFLMPAALVSIQIILLIVIWRAFQ